jgi:hypothetical protein
MNPTPAILIAILILGLILISPQLRAYMTHIALRLFFDRYMSEPRYRVTNPRSDDRKRR